MTAVGWKTCQGGYAENSTCLEPGAAAETGWRTNIRFYHVEATLAFSLSDLGIIEVEELTKREPYHITHADLFQSFNSVLYRPNQITNDARFDVKSTPYILTQTIGSYLWTSLNERAQSLPFARDWLRNLLMMPVYVFQPTVLAVGPQSHFLNNGTQVQPNLPPQNNITASYCAMDARSVPGWGTVLAYAIVGALVWGCICAGKAAATLWPEMEASEYPMLDFEVLTLLAKPNGQEASPLRNEFPETVYRSDKVLERVDDLRVGLRK